MHTPTVHSTPWLRIIAALALPLLLAAACGDDDDPPPASTATATEAASPSPPDATSEPTAPTESTAEPVPTATTSAQTPPPSGRPALGTRSGVATSMRDPAFEPLTGASAHFGQLGDAVYQIEVPDAWNGSLVLWAHGFRGFGTVVSVDSPPDELRTLFIAQGYAWAASSYSENGYTPGIGADDTLALKDFFTAEFGEPELTYLVGSSMGGNVATLALEHFGGEFDGALSMCGALSGIEQVDFLLSWLAVAEYTSGVEIPIGSDGLSIGNVLLSEVSPALGTPRSPTSPRGEQFISVIKLLTGGERPFYIDGLAEQYIDNFGLILLDPTRESLAARAASNEGHEYAIEDGLGLTAAEINADIRRLEADPEARNAANHPDAVPTTGQISVPLLALHGTGDLFVPISQAVSYQRKVNASGASDFLVQRAIRSPGHCNFSDDETVTAWNDLVAWVETGARPAGDDLLGDLKDIGLQFTTPLRSGDPELLAARNGFRAYAANIVRTMLAV